MVRLGLLPLACMLGWVTLSRGQNEPQALFPEECCTKKTVGGVAYTQVAGNTDGFDCTGQCVYEEDGKPGSRTCFKSGGPGPLPIECKESLIDSAYVSFARNSGIFTFNTAIGTYSCAVGSVTTDGETIECSKQEDQAAGSTSGSEEAAFFVSKSPDGIFEWMCFHTTDVGIHCDFLVDGIMQCRSVPSKEQKAATLFVECGIKIEGGVADCQTICNGKTNAECMFWTFSSNQDNPTVSVSDGNRFHDGGDSECGIREYEPTVLLRNINQNQFTGKWRNPTVNQGSVYVLGQTIETNADDCRAYCESIASCTVWTWQRKPESGSVCAINSYTPKRMVAIPKFAGPPQLISGCIKNRLNGLECTNLQANCP